MPMQAGYFSTVWRDITESPGWFGRLCLMGLVMLIPIFGQIVVFGYAFGWARDIAWNLKTPMPARIFGNEDGRLYSRGLHMFVISFVFGLVPYVIEQLWAMMGGGGVGTVSNMALGASAGGMMFNLLAAVVIFALSVFGAVFAYTGCIRSAVYCRLSPGFQLRRLWSMIRYDASGIARIFLMVFLVTIVASVVFCVGVFAAVVVVVPGVTMSPDSAFALPLALCGIVLLLALCFALMVVSAFITLIEARALGYWVAQFDVASWRGEDDPMPFELVGTSQGR